MKFVVLLALMTSGTVSRHSAASPSEELDRLQRLLSVPSSLGKVTEAYWPQAPVQADPPAPMTLPDYILIQDIHRHPQVQGKVSALIVHGYEQWGVNKVFLEGAFTALDLSVFHRVPKSTKSLLLEQLVQDGDLSGPELAAVAILEREWRNPPVSPFQLFGLEDPYLYRQNFLAYQSVLSQRDRALAELVSLRRWQGTMNLPEPNVLSEQLERMKSLLYLKLTPDEYAAYQKNKGAIPFSTSLDDALQAAEEFYRLVHLRSAFFLRQVQRIAPASLGPRIMVVGGFHTTHMAEGLRKMGRSFVVLAPAVNQELTDSPYEKRMQDTATALTDTLNSFPR